MLTLIKRDTNNKNNDLELNHYFKVPQNIQEEINEKGFYSYQWIGEKDVKNSIERDFLKYIEKYGAIISILFIIPCAILFFSEDKTLFFTFLFSYLGFINIIFVILLAVSSIYRTNILRNNAFIIITDKYISINGEIDKLSENGIKSNEKIDEITGLFEEEIFKESNIEQTKKGFFKKVIESLGKGYYYILKLGDRGSRNSFQIIILLFVLYTIYAISLGIIYFIGIIFIWILGIIIYIINKHILLLSGHKITNINKGFENIDNYSKNLTKEKDNLSILLNNAIKNDWQDGLLNDINKGLENINNYANLSVNSNIKLKEDINTSKYNEMFNFGIYNSWIKKQIQTPLEQILELLEQNLKTLYKNKDSIEKQIKKTTDISLSGALTASKTRTEIKIEEIEKHKKVISLYIEKITKN